MKEFLGTEILASELEGIECEVPLKGRVIAVDENAVKRNREIIFFSIPELLIAVNLEEAIEVDECFSIAKDKDLKMEYLESQLGTATDVLENLELRDDELSIWVTRDSVKEVI